jgi:hypothetical protein
MTVVLAAVAWPVCILGLVLCLTFVTRWSLAFTERQDERLARQGQEEEQEERLRELGFPVSSTEPTPAELAEAKRTEARATIADEAAGLARRQAEHFAAITVNKSQEKAALRRAALQSQLAGLLRSGKLHADEADSWLQERLQ